MSGLIIGKKYVLSTPVDTVITDVKYNIPLGTVKAGQQYVFQAVSDAVTVADGCTIRPFEGSNGAAVGVVGGSGDGGSSGGSSAYPGWVGYIEYDDETGEAIAADYSGLELSGMVPNSLKFDKIKFRGDWNGSIGKFTDGYNMFRDCSNLTSFNADLSNLISAECMFQGCKLDAPSVEKILTSISEYSDDSSHILRMTIQNGEAAAKFGEITGTTPSSYDFVSVSYKGWTIQVNIVNV